MKKVYKNNNLNSINRLLFKNGGSNSDNNSQYDYRIGVPGNRTFWQTAKENIQEYYNKLKGNFFGEMIFPFEDISKGNTTAMIPYIIGGPAYGTVRQLIKGNKRLLSKNFNKVARPVAEEQQKYITKNLDNYNDAVNKKLTDLYLNDDYVKRMGQEVDENSINIAEEWLEHAYGDTDSYWHHAADLYGRIYGKNSKQYKEALENAIKTFP